MYVSAPKSLYRRHFCGTENEIWAGFGPVGTTEKKMEVNYEQLLRAVFSCFQGQKTQLNFFSKYCSVRTNKMHTISLIFFFWILP